MTIIFDFDGTIANTWPVIIELLKHHRKEFRLPEITNEVVDDFRSKGVIELVKKYKFIVLKLPFIIPKIQKILFNHMKEISVFPGIEELLIKLQDKRYKLGILTTNTKENVEKFFKINNLIFFDFVHIENNIFNKGRALKKLIKENNLKPHETIYIGDENRDIDACKSAGIRIIAVTWGFNKKATLRENNPDYLVDKPSEILRIV